VTKTQQLVTPMQHLVTKIRYPVPIIPISGVLLAAGASASGGGRDPSAWQGAFITDPKVMEGLKSKKA
jgi:hypothetical protein